jgi:ABC-type glycerol-3-phosphate transport system substrate-binding protein
MNHRAIVYCIALAVCASAHAASTKSDSQSAPRKNEEKPSLEMQLESAKKDLAALLKEFTEENPRIKAQRRKIADLEEAIAHKKREKA